MTTTREAMNTLLKELRALAPKRALTYGESMQLARIQAGKVRNWAAQTQLDINLVWLTEQTVVPVHFVPSHRLHEESGLTTDLISGKLEIYINRTEPVLRQRFSLLHEFKHALDFSDATQLHAGLGSGNLELQAKQIELVANEFAGQVLMPRKLIASAWRKTGDLSLMAALFNVSAEAMRTRLTKLGFLGSTPPSPRHYFRSCGQTLSRSTRRALEQSIFEDEVAA